MFGLTPEMTSLFITLGLGGFATTAIYFIYGLVLEQIEKKFMTQVTVDNMDPVYKWLLQFLT
jgi:hypothetical protein